MKPALAVHDLTVELDVGNRVLRPVDGVSLRVEEGSTTALIGESGCGKTMTALAVMGLLPEGARVRSGALTVAGAEIAMFDGNIRELRQTTLAMVFQDPFAAFNPVMPVGSQIAEVFRLRGGLSRREATRRSIEMLERVGIPHAGLRHRDPPHRFSGGMLQRAMFAMAVALRPRILIADEPTTALDVTVQAQILELLADLKRETAMALLLITHDLGVVASLADEVVLMYAGRVVEEAPAAAFFRRPQHPYARALLGAVPSMRTAMKDVTALPGTPPELSALPAGCRFHPRCPYVVAECRGEDPRLRPTPEGRAACLRLEEIE